MTISVHWVDHFGTTTSVHIGVQLRYTERTLYVPFRYIHFGTFSNTVTVTEVLSDFEAAVWRTFRNVFGQHVTHRGCVFH